MPHFLVDDGFYSHPKITGIPRGAKRERAVGLWTMAGSWSAKYLTEGQIPRAQISEFGSSHTIAGWLVDAGLWDRTPDGYAFHQWTGNGNRTRAEVEAYRAAKKAAGAKGGKASGQSRRGSKPPTNSEAPASRLVEHLDLDQSASNEAQNETADAVSGDPPPLPPHEPPAPKARNTQSLLTEWISSCAKRPPSSVVSHVGREVRAMLIDGIDYEDLRSGLQRWQSKGLHPSTLPSVVHEVRNPPAPRGSTATQRVEQAASLQGWAAELDATEPSPRPQLRAIGGNA